MTPRRCSPLMLAALAVALVGAGVDAPAERPREPPPDPPPPPMPRARAEEWTPVRVERDRRPVVNTSREQKRRMRQAARARSRAA